MSSTPHARSRPGVAPLGTPWVFPALVGAMLTLAVATSVHTLLGALALMTEALFVVFFVRHLAFAVNAMRAAPADLGAPLVDTGYRPAVSVLVACKNEESVVDGLVRALDALEYPAGRRQLIVVDDGSDDTTGARLDAWARQLPDLHVVHRAAGVGGGKSGALNAALEFATGEIIVVFDADHTPRPDVLTRLVRHFEDPTVGAVQGRCEIRNARQSLLARLVAIDYLAGYLINEYGRQSLFSLPAYGGANCAVRASSLRALGGWNPNTVTEDTDLTLRLALCGQRVRYDVTAVDGEEGVLTIRRYWRQRYRWARGHQQVWRDFRRAVWSSRRFSLIEKIETTMFLLAFHVPVFSALGLGLLGLWLTGVADPTTGFDISILWTLLFLGPLLEHGGGLLVGRADRRDVWVLVYFLPVFLVSIALCTKAWIDGVAGRPYTWAKTQRARDVAVAA